MSTAQTTNIYITNSTDGDAIINLSHRYSNNKPETGSWRAKPGETVGPLVVNYETGFGTGMDYWFVGLNVFNGSTQGTYASSATNLVIEPTTGSPYYAKVVGSIDNPNKECMLKSSDANRNITFTVDTKKLRLKIPSGAAGATMSRLAPFHGITNVFVLMLENHSFDHLLGFSKMTGFDINGNAASINGVPLTDEQTPTNSYGSNGSTVTYHVTTPAVDPMPSDPGHEFLDTLEQLCGVGTVNPFKPATTSVYPPINNSGFLANYATSTTSELPSNPGPAPADVIQDILACCNPSTQIPVLYQLAQEFAVCDNWFSSMPGPTVPNRFFAMCGTSNGLDDSPPAKWKNAAIKEAETVSGYVFPKGSIFQLLNQNRLNWRIYSDWNNQFSSNPSDGTMWTGGAYPISAAIKGVNFVTDTRDFGYLHNDLQGAYSTQFTWIEPNYGNAGNNSFQGGSSQHPMDSLAAGEALIAATYNAIRNSPVWNTSVLIITYDEHGGFYDSAFPPAAIPPDSSTKYNTCGFNFTNYGVRVPAVIVSPLIKKNTIDHTLYDHTSILKTVEILFNLPNLTARDEAANSLLCLNLTAVPRTDCPQTITAPPVPPLPPLPTSNSLIETDDGSSAPIPDQGNLPTFLRIALKTDFEMSDGSEATKAALLAKFESLQTLGQADAYLKEVLQKAMAAKAESTD